MGIIKQGSKISSNRGDIMNDGSFDEKVKEHGLDTVADKSQKFLESLKPEEKVVSALVVMETQKGCVVSQMIRPQNIEKYNPNDILEAVKQTLEDDYPKGKGLKHSNVEGVETAKVLCEYSLDIMKFMNECQDRDHKIDVDIVGMKMKRLMTERLADLVTEDLFAKLMKGL